MQREELPRPQTFLTQPNFTGHPKIMKAQRQGALPKEPRANTEEEETLHHLPQPFPRGLAQLGQGRPCAQGCMSVGRGPSAAHILPPPGWRVPSRGLPGRAPHPALRYLGRGRAAELLHAICGAALLFWARGWRGPGR